MSSKAIFTSEEKPLEIASVGVGKGTLGFCMVPGRTKEKSQHIWKRDLESDLHVIIDYRDSFGEEKNGTVVTLLSDAELTAVGSSELRDRCLSMGLGHIQHPIRDKWIPSSFAEFCQLVDDVYNLVAGGQAVVIHCNGGKGRSALLTACILLWDRTLSPSEAISKVQGMSNGALRNPLQQIYLRAVNYWGRR